MQEDLMQLRYGKGFASNVFQVWFGLRLKLAELIVLCQLPLNILDSSLSASVLCIICTFFDTFTANDSFGHFAEF